MVYIFRTGESQFFDTSALLVVLRRPNLTHAERVNIQCATLGGGVPFDFVKPASASGRAKSAGATV